MSERSTTVDGRVVPLPGRNRGQIVSFGGGFSMEAGNPLLDDYVLEITGKRRPRVCFPPTAGGGPEARAWCVGDAGTEMAETELPVRYLGERSPASGDGAPLSAVA